RRQLTFRIQTTGGLRVRIARISADSRVPATGDLFVGAVERQQLVGEEDSQQVRVGVVTFKDGAVNKLHRHTFDQALVITEGDGIVQVEGEPQQFVTVGDVIFVPAGERHWHGAAPGKT